MIGQLLNRFKRASKENTQRNSRDEQFDEDYREDNGDLTFVRGYGWKPLRSTMDNGSNSKASSNSNNATTVTSLVGAFPVIPITHPGLTLTHEYVLKTLVKPRADFEIAELFRNYKWSPKVSEQHIRTCRNQLVKKGLVEWTGEYRRTESGRNAKVWRSKREQETL